jgi:glycosyltransferase involved in cell wall biosynthesis
MIAPLVSVLLPVYNRAKYLPIAIESVLAQEMSNLELVVCDNVSTDESAQIAESYARQDRRVKFFRNTAHVSAVENYNLCHRRSDPASKYIAVLASDDWWEPALLARLLKIAWGYSSATFVYADMNRVDADGRIINTYSDLYRHVTPAPGPHRAVRELYFGNYINVMASLISREQLARIYPPAAVEIYDPSLKLAPDFNLWVQLLTRGAYTYYLDEPLAAYRTHEDSMTAKPANRIPRLHDEIAIFRDRLRGVCPPELEDLRREALQQRLAQVGFLLLEENRADEATAILHEARRAHSGRRLDLDVARAIATLPVPAGGRTGLWRMAMTTARALGRVT